MVPSDLELFKLVHCRGSPPYMQVLENLLSDKLRRKCINLLTGGMSRKSRGANCKEEISHKDGDKSLLHLDADLCTETGFSINTS